MIGKLTNFLCSEAEFHLCHISDADCPARVEGGHNVDGAATDDF